MQRLSFTLSVIWVECTFLVLRRDLRSLRANELQFDLVCRWFCYYSTYTHKLRAFYLNICPHFIEVSSFT